MKYDVVVIGAGVGGLTSALKLSMARKKVLLLERYALPGGYATTFRRGGFTFESAVHCVDGLNKGGDIRNFLEDARIDKNIELIELKNFARFIYPGHDFITDFNPDNFIAYLKKEFPQEKDNIDKLFADIEAFYREFDRFRSSHLPMWLTVILSLVMFPHIVKASTCTIGQYLNKYLKDKKAISIITAIWGFMGLPPEKLSAFYFMLVFRGYYYNNTAYVKGGFLKLFQAMVNKFERLGGETRFNAIVTKIKTDKNGSVKSIIINNGEEIEAGAVVSGINPIDTLVELLDDDKAKDYYRKCFTEMDKSISAVQLYLGLKVPAKNLGMNEFLFFVNSSYGHEEHFNSSLSGDYDRCSIELVDHAQIDPSLVPEGKGSLLIMVLDSHTNWYGLSNEEYRNKKQELAKKLISRAEKYLPGLSQNIEVMEMATPKTMHSYTLSPEGAIYGFAQTLSQSGINRLAQETKIKGLFLSGAWTSPGGGVHACFISGITAADLVFRYLTKRN